MFKMKLSQEIRDFLNAKEVELARLYKLNNRWLADALLQLSRAARLESPHLTSEENVYENTFIWHVVPEIARRLGATKFLLGEREDWEINHMSNEKLRDRSFRCIQNISESTYWKKSGWYLLLNDPLNGNPVVYAIDRLSPGDMENKDALTKRMLEIARIRKVEYLGVWTPEMMMYVVKDKPEGFNFGEIYA